MSDAQASQNPVVPAATDDDTRALAIVVYALYLAALLSCGIAGIAGVIVAYIKKDTARGTLWESHFDNQISAFWVWFGLFVLGVATSWMLGLGILIIAFAFIWFLYRTIKGLLRALERQPYI